MLAFLPILALVAPLGALAVESLFPYPHLVEELFKGLIVYQIPQTASIKTRISISVLAGILFATTETVIYATSIFLAGNTSLFLERIIATSFVHALTASTMAVSMHKRKEGIFIGFLIAALIHYLYNLS